MLAARVVSAKKWLSVLSYQALNATKFGFAVTSATPPLWLPFPVAYKYTKPARRVSINPWTYIGNNFWEICWNRRIFQGNSMSLHGFLCDSMPTPFVGSRRFLLYDHEGLFVSCFQKILCFYHVYNEPESPVIRELTHFHRLHQQNWSRKTKLNEEVVICDHDCVLKWRSRQLYGIQLPFVSFSSASTSLSSILPSTSPFSTLIFFTLRC